MKTHKVLICDDNEGIRESLKLILGDYYDLILTSDGAQCLECLKGSQDIGLILLDIKMPKVDGLEMLKTIKRKYPALSVVMITGYQTVEAASEASHLGACGYITKPFKTEEILETVKKNLEK